MLYFSFGSHSLYVLILFPSSRLDRYWEGTRCRKCRIRTFCFLSGPLLVEPNRVANETTSTSLYMYFAPQHTKNESVTMPELVPHALSRDSEHAEMAAAPGSGRAEGLGAANQAGSGGRTVGGLGLALARCPLSQALRETTNLRSPSCVLVLARKSRKKVVQGYIAPFYLFPLPLPTRLPAPHCWSTAPSGAIGFRFGWELRLFFSSFRKQAPWPEHNSRPS